MKEMNPKQKLSTARLKAVDSMPYFASGLYLLSPIWVPDGTFSHVSDEGTMGVTEDYVLLIEPRCVEKWNIDQIAGVLIHEMLHCLRDHKKRADQVGAVTPPLQFVWNLAADCEINDDIISAGLSLPDDNVNPKQYNMEEGLAAEAYYQKLLDHMNVCSKCRDMANNMAKGNGDTNQNQSDSDDGKGDEGKNQNQSDSDDGKGDEGKNQNQSDSDDGKKGKGKSNKGKGKKGKCPICEAMKKAGTAAGRCGSGAGNPLPGEDDIVGKNKNARRTKAEVKAAKKMIAADIQKEQEKSRGNIPSNWSVWADQILQPPKIDWRTKLAQIVRRAIAYRSGAVDFKYTRTSRRQSVLGYGAGKPILPALMKPVPNVAIAIDTSGSMSQDDLACAVSESSGILSAVGANVTLLSCDASVGEVKSVCTVDALTKSLVGGGGTDFAPVFDAIKEMKMRPEVLVYATDGCGPAPAKPVPGMHTIWLLIGRYRETPWFPEAPWGEIIHVDDLDVADEVA